MAKLYVVGIGPGNYENMTIRADRALQESDVIIGYNVYVDLVKDRYPDKEFMTTPMTKEALRCQIAVDKAKEGKTTSMICSGDSGIYGMAALVYEIRGEETEPEIEVIPGLTAAASGASILGAPLTHDFAVISLSDRLTPWEKIEERLRAASKADLSIVLYNPVSKGRPDHLKKACDIMLENLPESRICGIARNIGREGESMRVLTLKELKDADCDMFCTVFIGNAMTKVLDSKMVTPRGYREVNDGR
ncbi:MAG: precorrin-3B C(17)-methyltransferase [Firmicutes bacterium]|nr:precorrin-3B C(17)-methyltransferase [Bacillota bacterium]